MKSSKVVVVLVLALLAVGAVVFAQKASIKGEETTVKGPDSGFVVGDGVVEETADGDVVFGEEKPRVRCSGKCGDVSVGPWTCAAGQNCFLNCTTNPPTGSCI
jgi:hypothetical protein